METIIVVPTFSKATHEDAVLILPLLRENLRENLSADDTQDGFVTFNPTPAELNKIIGDTGVIVCKSSGKLAGYFITMSKELAVTVPFEEDFLKNIVSMKYEDKKVVDYNYCIYAQICVAKEFRGQNSIFKHLHVEAEKLLRGSGYEIAVAEIDDENAKSLSVHNFMQEIGIYNSSNGTKWHVVIKKLKNK